MSSDVKTYDVVIVGAGPAGASAAGSLAKTGLQVIILEQKCWPRNKTCGGGLIIRALKELPHEVKLPISHHCHKASIQLNDRTQCFTTVRDEPIVSMIMRSEFDQTLITAAMEKGALFQDECSVTGMHQEENTVKLETSKGPIHARLVIAADGVRSTIATLAGWPDGRILAPALEWELDVPIEVLQSHANVARFDFSVIEDGYAWVFPKEDHLSVGIGTMRGRSRNLPGALERYLADLEIPFKKSLSRKGHLIPVSPRKSKFAQGRILLVGDAAGFTDPVTAEGISFALQSGRLAAEAICVGELDPTRVASEYQRRLQQNVLPEIRCGRWFATLLYRFPAGRDWLFSHHGQRLAERMTDLITGDLSYRQILYHSPFWLRILGLRTIR